MRVSTVGSRSVWGRFTHTMIGTVNARSRGGSRGCLATVTRKEHALESCRSEKVVCSHFRIPQPVGSQEAEVRVRTPQTLSPRTQHDQHHQRGSATKQRSPWNSHPETSPRQSICYTRIPARSELLMRRLIGPQAKQLHKFYLWTLCRPSRGIDRRRQSSGYLCRRTQGHVVSSYDSTCSGYQRVHDGECIYRSWAAHEPAYLFTASTPHAFSSCKLPSRDMAKVALNSGCL